MARNEKRSALRPGETLGEQVYREIRTRLGRGEWLPGTKLTLRGLAKDLGTSIQPVRYAVGKLAADQAMVLRPNAGITLPPVDRQLLDEIFAHRNLLEGEAARRSAALMTESDLEDLRAATIEARRAHAKRGNMQDRVAATNAIAFILAERSGMKILSEQILALRTRTAPYYAAAMRLDDEPDPDFAVFTRKIQDELLMALRRRHAMEAEYLRRADLYSFQHYIYRTLRIE